MVKIKCDGICIGCDRISGSLIKAKYKYGMGEQCLVRSPCHHRCTRPSGHLGKHETIAFMSKLKRAWVRW